MIIVVVIEIDKIDYKAAMWSYVFPNWLQYWLGITLVEIQCIWQSQVWKVQVSLTGHSGIGFGRNM